jgi:aryl-alcohol dehydrogenase-like predicted oxidoreductase
MLEFRGGLDHPDEQTSIQIIHAAIDAGINLFDVAPVYGWGRSETISGKGA